MYFNGMCYLSQTAGNINTWNWERSVIHKQPHRIRSPTAKNNPRFNNRDQIFQCIKRNSSSIDRDSVQPHIIRTRHPRESSWLCRKLIAVWYSTSLPLLPGCHIHRHPVPITQPPLRAPGSIAAAISYAPREPHPGYSQSTFFPFPTTQERCFYYVCRLGFQLVVAMTWAGTRVQKMMQRNIGFLGAAKIESFVTETRVTNCGQHGLFSEQVPCIPNNVFINYCFSSIWNQTLVKMQNNDELGDTIITLGVSNCRDLVHL